MNKRMMTIANALLVVSIGFCFSCSNTTDQYNDKFLFGNVVTEPIVTIIPPPVNQAFDASFIDEDPSPGKVNGTIYITKAGDESDITDYVVYFGSDPTTKLAQLAFIPKTGNDISYPVVVGTLIPKGTKYLLVYTLNDGGEMDTGVAIQIQFLKPNLYILIDGTGSMSIAITSTSTRLSVLQTALNGMSDQLTTDFNIGVGKFPFDTNICNTANNPFNLLPMQTNVNSNGFKTSYASIVPAGGTSMYAALTGLLNRNLFEIQNDPYNNRIKAIILITDGLPTNNCTGSVVGGDMNLARTQTINAVTEIYNRGIFVFVLGFPNVEAAFLNSLATEGGTSQYYIISDTASITQALDSIRDTL